MPVHEVKGGYQWGNTGKIYKGKDAKKKAIKQAIAIAYSEAERQGKEKPSQEDITKTIKGEEITKEANMNYPIRNTMAALQKCASERMQKKAGMREMAVKTLAHMSPERIGATAAGAGVGGAVGAGGAYLIAKYLLKKKLSTAAMVGAGLAGAGVGGAAGYGAHRLFGAPATAEEMEARSGTSRYTGENGDKVRAKDLDAIGDRIRQYLAAGESASRKSGGQDGAFAREVAYAIDPKRAENMDSTLQAAAKGN